MLKVKQALRKISFTTKKKDTSSPGPTLQSTAGDKDGNALQLSPSSQLSSSSTLSQSHTTGQSGSYPTLDERHRKISYDEVLSVRKYSSPRKKSENLIDYLNLDSKGVELSALLAENNTKQRKESPIKTQSHSETQSRSIPTRKNSLQGLLLKQSKSSNIQTRRSCHSYEPNKLLVKAITDGYMELVEGLLSSAQVNINKLNEDGYAPLHLAAFQDKADIIRTLINYGAFIDILDSTGFSPLEVAINEGSFECAQVLIENGADQTLILDGHFDTRRSRASSMDEEYQKHLKEMEK